MEECALFIEDLQAIVNDNGIPSWFFPQFRCPSCNGKIGRHHRPPVIGKFY